MMGAYPLALLSLLLWSFLATLFAQLAHLPPLLLVGSALTLGGLLGLPQVKAWRVPWRTLLVGVWGIFGYHFMLFLAIQRAPAVEANLINYLWPLLIVLLTPVVLPGNPLAVHHFAGALLGFLGAGLIVTGGQFRLDMQYLPGYALAGGAALTWALYSLLTKRAPAFSSAAVGAFCLISGLLSLGVYFSRGGAMTLTGGDALLLTLLGLGPMGLAFFTWDAAMKRGDARIIGSLAYLAPLFSTLNLILFAGKTFRWTSVIAMVLILTGALVGSWDLLRKPRPLDGFMKDGG